MLKNTKSLLNKALYLFIFIVLIPISLLSWAKSTNSIINWPPVGGGIIGWVLIDLGLLIMIWAIYLLKKSDKGLFVQFLSPKHIIQEGPYRLFKHPVYWGFISFILGFFILTKMPSGVWLVTPTAVLATLALVWGYEKIDLEKRFPNYKAETLLRLPEKGIPVSMRDRFAAMSWVVLTIVICNFFVRQFINNSIPLYGKVLESFQLGDKFYYKFMSLAFIISTIFIIKHKHVLRQWTIVSLLSFYLALFVNVIWPESNLHWYSHIGSLFRPSISSAIDLFAVPMCLIFVCLHCVFRESKVIALPWLAFAGFIEYKNITLNMVRIEYFMFYLAVYIFAINYYNLWLLLRRVAEFIANSWQEWTIGKLKILSHGFYVGAGIFLGMVSASMLVGKEYSWAILIFTIVILISSLFWTKVIERGKKFKRPFGYYGALIGSIFAAIILYLIGYNVWLILTVIAVVMPRSQAVGKIKCLVKGCCHGSKVDNEDIGIRYFHEKSTVSSVSNLSGELLHPTPLYSMIWLFVVGFVMLSMWLHKMPFSLICGLYLILTGIGRFIEEAYRGEVNIIIYRGLKLYQWTALISVVVGIFLTTINTGYAEVVTPSFSWEILIPSAIGGILVNFAMGIEFPKLQVEISKVV